MRGSTISPSPRRVSQPRLAAPFGNTASTTFTSAGIQTQIQTINDASNSDRLLLHGALVKVDAQQAKLESQENLLDLQGGLISELENKLSDIIVSFDSIRRDMVMNQQVVKDAVVDIQSCVSQYEGFGSRIERLEKKQAILNREILSDVGKLSKLQLEMSDVDVALASERDRVTEMREGLRDLRGKVEGLMSCEGTAAESSASGSGIIRRTRKTSSTNAIIKHSIAQPSTPAYVSIP